MGKMTKKPGDIWITDCLNYVDEDGKRHEGKKRHSLGYKSLLKAILGVKDVIH